MSEVQPLPIPQDIVAGKARGTLRETLATYALAAVCLAAGAPDLLAQRTDPTSIQVILDNSAAMAAPDGTTPGRGLLARAYMEALRGELDATGSQRAITVRVYGGGKAAGEPSCRMTDRLPPAVDPALSWDASARGLIPSGPSPLAFALAEAMSDSAGTYVLIAGAADTCGEDACARWSALSAGHHARIHVVAVDVEPDVADRLHCLSRAGKGSFSEITDTASAAAAARRLAMILANEGVLDVRFTIGDGARFPVPVRVVRPLTRELVVAYTARGPRRLGAGMYAVTAGTIPPTVFDRVLVLPGDTARVGGSEFGNLIVHLRGDDNRTVHAPVTVRRSTGGPDLRFFTTGDTVVLGSGGYDVRVDLGDSLLVRKGVVVRRGESAEVGFGGTGTLTIVAPEFAAPPATKALVSRGGEVDTLELGAAARLPAGRYRLIVQSVPMYVSEEVVIRHDEETAITLPTTGILGVDLRGVDGYETDIRVDVIEPLTGEVYGALTTGERRLVMPGRYELVLATIPPRTVSGVAIEPGGSRVVALGGLSSVAVVDSAPVGDVVRLEVLTRGGGRGLGEATGRAPRLAVWPGRYLVRVWSGTDLSWEGPVTVAEGERARIHSAGP